MAECDLTAARLRELLNYEPTSGVFTWKCAASRRVSAGQQAGRVQSRGYRQITVDRAQLYAHRLAWLYMTGGWPSGQVDHINGEKDDNRWSNLRDVSAAVNTQNQVRAQSKSTTGLLGVSKQKSRQRFRATIKIGCKTVCIGTYATPEEAHWAYLDAKRKLHAGCTI